MYIVDARQTAGLQEPRRGNWTAFDRPKYWVRLSRCPNESVLIAHMSCVRYRTVEEVRSEQGRSFWMVKDMILMIMLSSSAKKFLDAENRSTRYQ
jgi:hypothetical protein